MVEVQFGIQHWHIKDADTFQATPEKVTILKLGPIHALSNCKWPNPSGDEDKFQVNRKQRECIHLRLKKTNISHINQNVLKFCFPDSTK
jgi:hypothetical protein